MSALPVALDGTSPAQATAPHRDGAVHQRAVAERAELVITPAPERPTRLHCADMRPVRLPFGNILPERRALHWLGNGAADGALSELPNRVHPPAPERPIRLHCAVDRTV